MSSTPVKAEVNWHGPGGVHMVERGFRRVGGCPFTIFVVIPTSLPTLAFRLSLLKNGKLFLLNGEGGKKLLEVYARAFQDGAPLGEAGPPWNFPPISLPQNLSDNFSCAKH